MTVSDKVHALVLDAIAPFDVELYDLEHTGGVLRVTLDRPGGIDVDVLTDANRALSRMLDEADPIPGSYLLEVSSPGLERVLRTPAHWSRAVGEQVRVKTRPGTDGDRRVEGVVVGVDEGRALLGQPDGSVTSILLDDIERARTVFKWGPAPKPGTGSKPGAAPRRGANTASGAKKSTAATGERNQTAP